MCSSEILSCAMLSNLKVAGSRQRLPRRRHHFCSVDSECFGGIKGWRRWPRQAACHDPSPHTCGERWSWRGRTSGGAKAAGDGSGDDGRRGGRHPCQRNTFSSGSGHRGSHCYGLQVAATVGGGVPATSLAIPSGDTGGGILTVSPPGGGFSRATAGAVTTGATADTPQRHFFYFFFVVGGAAGGGAHGSWVAAARAGARRWCSPPPR